jgi:hypothetical protein
MIHIHDFGGKRSAARKAMKIRSSPLFFLQGPCKIVLNAFVMTYGWGQSFLPKKGRDFSKMSKAFLFFWQWVLARHFLHASKSSKRRVVLGFSG